MGGEQVAKSVALGLVRVMAASLSGERSVRDGVTLLGPLRTVYRSRRYGVTLLGPLMAVERTEGLRQGLRRDTQVVVFAQLQVAQLQDASG